MTLSSFWNEQASAHRVEPLDHDVDDALGTKPLDIGGADEFCRRVHFRSKLTTHE